MMYEMQELRIDLLNWMIMAFCQEKCLCMQCQLTKVRITDRRDIKGLRYP